LARERLLENASLAANCGMEGEVLCPRLSELEEETGYFSLVVVKRGEK
jgi:precorrin-2/cobalt-factor-2 C20-methyltransferase